MKNNNFITIQGFMVNELHLKGNELLIYAIIFGFSQDDETDYHGGTSYLMKWTGISKQNVLKNLNSLVEKGYINKIEIYNNNVKFCNYTANSIENIINNSTDIADSTTGAKTIPGGAKIAPGGGTKIAPNNIDINIIDNTINKNIKKSKISNSLKSKPTQFIFRNSKVFNLVDYDEDENIINSDRLKDKFKIAVANEIDIVYYFEAVKNWSDMNIRKVRTDRGWIATINNFMNRDKESNKLKKIDPYQQPDFDLDAALKANNY